MNPHDQNTANQLFSEWTSRVAGEEESRNHMPVTTMQNEAKLLALLVEEYTAPLSRNGSQRPGLSSLMDSGMLPATISKEIGELAIAIGEAQARYQILSQRLSEDPNEAADEMLEEMKAVLSFLLEDGEHPEGEGQLDALRESFTRITSQEDMAAALEGYAELCEFHADELKAIPTYDPELGNRAIQAAQALRQRYVDRTMGSLLQEQREMLELRNRLITALKDRMSTARRAFRFLFRDYPSIVRQAGSEYERSRRRAARRGRSDDRSGSTALTAPSSIADETPPPPAQL